MGKIAYRAGYRSTKEMDLILRRFWNVFKDRCTENELTVFEKLIDEDDLNLYRWIASGDAGPPEYVSLVSQIRKQILQENKRCR